MCSYDLTFSEGETPEEVIAMADPKIEMMSPAALRPYAKNARTHSRKQVKQIAQSIRTFGFTNPVLIDRENIDPRRTRPGRGGEAAWHDRGALRSP